VIAVLRMSIFWSLEAARRGSPWRWTAPKQGLVSTSRASPRKRWLAGPELYIARHAKVMGVELGDQALISVDGLRGHMSSVVDGMVAAHKKMFADSGMDFILGTARFIAPRTVEVETRDENIRLLRGTDVVINTGRRRPSPI
jgi:pyruvate/2-oxoglutarate dehydrogenase complex dihydrolipoamide dehydrogenase (E3) component